METKKYRSAKTGKFVSKDFAKSNKETTVGETVTKRKKKITKKKEEVLAVEEVVDTSRSIWVDIADFIYYGGIVILTSFAFGMMSVFGNYFALYVVNL